MKPAITVRAPDASGRRAIAAGHLHDDFAALSHFMGKAG